MGTFVIVNIGWYFDRIIDMSDCWLCLKNTFTNFAGLNNTLSELMVNVDTFSVRSMCVVGLTILLVLICSILSEKDIDVFKLLQRKNIVIRWGIYYLMLALVQISMSMANSSEPFLYAVF